MIDVLRVETIEGADIRILVRNIAYYAAAPHFNGSVFYMVGRPEPLMIALPIDEVDQYLRNMDAYIMGPPNQAAVFVEAHGEGTITKEQS